MIAWAPEDRDPHRFPRCPNHAPPCQCEIGTTAIVYRAGPIATDVGSATNAPYPSKPLGFDHCGRCGSKRKDERRPVETRRPGPKGAGRGTRKPCDAPWHDATGSGGSTPPSSPQL